MIGTPFHFTEQEFTLHKRMCTLLAQEFGQLKVSQESHAVMGLECNGKSLHEVLEFLNQRLGAVIAFSAKEIEDSANLLDVTAKLAQVSIKTPPANKSKSRHKKNRRAAAKAAKPTPITPPLSVDEQKELFYDSLHANLYFCQTLCTYLFQALYHHKLEALKKNSLGFQHVISYFLLLSCILNYNMLAYQTHPVHKKVDIDRMKRLFGASKNWTLLLESFHLNYGQGNDFNELRKQFVQRMIDFKHQLSENPEYIDLLTDDMLLPFSIEELSYHLAQKNERSERLGLPYNGYTVIPDANTLYNASAGSEKSFFEKLLTTCLDESNTHKRAQFLFYYNEADGNVDVFDVKQNPTNNCLEIINVHTGNSCAHHDLLLRIQSILSMSNMPFKLLACQASLGPKTQSSALYAFKISSLLSKKSFADIQANSTLPQPYFMDEAHNDAQQLFHIPQIEWFPIETLGDKAVLLIHSLEKRQALLKERFNRYQQQYGLSEMLENDPETLYNYADDYRKRLAHRHLRKSPFANLTDEKLKQKLTTEDNGQMVRRAAAGFANTREFEFLVEQMKKKDQAHTLHLPAKEKDYTPLHWTLKKQSAKKAAILLSATPFTDVELSEKNKDNKSAKDYFAESQNPRVKENPVLQRFLK